MKHIEGTCLYEADEGKLLARKSDGKLIGLSICLGENDNIGNYVEIDATEEQIAEFKHYSRQDNLSKKKNASRKDIHKHEIKFKPDGFEKLKKMWEETKKSKGLQK